MDSTEPSPSKKSNQSNSYLRYAGLGVQLLVAIGVAGWLGYVFDQYLQIKFPAFMLLFGFLAFGGMMVQIYRSINR